MDDQQGFKCWGCSKPEQNGFITVIYSSNGYYGFMPRSICSKSADSQVSDINTCGFRGGRKRTYKEMCSGVNFEEFKHPKLSCKC